ncbi:MAG: Elongation factor Ts [Proteobacteria bacterium]|jgi:elongation factor Ts|nr:MAG: Elongation factor Ts [Pseudomonadota bacterium]|tara:strand:+ start:1475 stop:2353 length:879 start_codon:yes stop_codon:yes gene_type:complete
MAITAADVKKLRDATGAGMMDCKKALTENEGDFDASVDWLRAKGIAKAAKKGDRVAAEGMVAIVSEGNKGAIVEVNSETDFVAKNDKFVEFVNNVAKVVLETKISDVEELKSAAYPTGGTVEETLTNLIATIGENMNLRRAQFVEVENGSVAAYSHMNGKIGVITVLEGSAEAADTAKQIAMHVAAQNPQALNREAVSPESLAREEAVFKEQAAASGKPEAVIEKMIVGKINKFYKEVCLVEQPFIMDTDKTVAKVAEEAGCVVKEYVRFGLGEGIEKKEEDFAAEVASMTK